MVALLLTITVMFVLVGIMYLTDTNRKKYTDFQMKKILQDSNNKAFSRL